MSVDAEQRFTSRRPCPICSGWDAAKRHTGARCYGYIARGGHTAICTRPETAGHLEYEMTVSGYRHRLHGLCGCGETHNAGPEMHADRRNGSIPEQHYELRDAEGTLIATHVRYCAADTGRNIPRDRPRERSLLSLGMAPSVYVV